MAQDFDSSLFGVGLDTSLGKVADSLDALRSSFIGGTAPPVTVAGMLWADTSAAVLNIRNATNTAWVEVASLATSALHAFTINKGTASASFTYYMGRIPTPAEIVGCYLITHPGGTSNASDFWQFQLRNLTQANDLLATAKSTWIGSADDPVEDVPYSIPPDQNLVIATGDVLEFQATKNGAAAALTETCVQVVYKPR